MSDASTDSVLPFAQRSLPEIVIAPIEGRTDFSLEQLPSPAFPRCFAVPSWAAGSSDDGNDWMLHRLPCVNAESLPAADALQYNARR